MGADSLLEAVEGDAPGAGLGEDGGFIDHDDFSGFEGGAKSDRLPVFNPQARHAAKLVYIMSDENRPDTQRMASH